MILQVYSMGMTVVCASDAYLKLSQKHPRGHPALRHPTDREPGLTAEPGGSAFNAESEPGEQDSRIEDGRKY
jgi:hypothetical protein